MIPARPSDGSACRAVGHRGDAILIGLWQPISNRPMSSKSLVEQLLTVDTARWVLLFPVLIVVWHIVVLAGILFASSLVHFCGPEDLVSGTCSAQWYSRTVKGLMVGFSGMSAIAVVASAYLMTPRFKAPVTWIVFGVGAVTAIIMAAAGQALWESVSTIGCGWLAARLCAGTHGQKFNTQNSP